jgi:hypothetical protein
MAGKFIMVVIFVILLILVADRIETNQKRRQDNDKH